MARPSPPSRLWGAVALALYATHALHHVRRGHPEDALWACHVGVVLVAAGFLARAPRANAVGFLWLVFGTACWVLDLASGGEFHPTSLLTHVGGVAIATLGLSRFGMPAGAWWQGMIAFLLLQQLCRWLTPPAANVNVAFAVWAGWEGRFPSYPLYIVTLCAAGSATFFVLETLARRFVARP